MKCDDTGNTAHECDCNCGEPRYEHGTCNYHGGAPYMPCKSTIEADARRTWTANLITWPLVPTWMGRREAGR